jgi:hypothetical protein
MFKHFLPPQFISVKAPLGQNFEHFSHLMHNFSFIDGALNPSCKMAPTGQTRIAGHL